MKKLITISAIGIIAGILFSACSSNMSVTKRHYTKGYYVEHSNSKRTVTKATTEEKVVKTEPKKSLTPAQNVSVPGNVILSPEKNSVLNEKIGKTESKKNQFKKIPVQDTNHVQVNSSKITGNPIARLKGLIMHKGEVSGASDREGLSLFWIVILVILILWALGFGLGGFGLGALINLLLLVALILLVLWLLRII